MVIGQYLLGEMRIRMERAIKVESLLPNIEYIFDETIDSLEAQL